MEPSTDTTTHTALPAELEHLSALFSTFEKHGVNVYQSNLGVSVTASSLQGQVCKNIDELHWSEEAMVGTVATFKSTVDNSPMVTFAMWLTVPASGAVADQLLGENKGAVDALSDMQQSAMEELLNQWLNATVREASTLTGKKLQVANISLLAGWSVDILKQQAPLLYNATSEPGGVVELQVPYQVGEGEAATSLMVTFAFSGKELDGLVPKALKKPAPIDVSAMVNQAVNQFNEEASSQPIAGAATGYQTPPPPPSAMSAQPVRFGAFDAMPVPNGDQNRNLELVMDVMLNITAELGKTHISIKEVLDLNRGSVIELDRVAGEPVDLLVNGKLVAKGEVIVIEDNFGLRITSIVSPAERLKGL